MRVHLIPLILVSLLAYGCGSSDEDIDYPFYGYSDLTTLELISNNSKLRFTDASCNFSDQSLYDGQYYWNDTFLRQQPSYQIPLDLKESRATYTFTSGGDSYKLALIYELVVKNGNPGYNEYFNSKWMTIETYAVDTLNSSPIFKNMYFEYDNGFKKDSTAFCLLRTAALK